MDLSWPPQAWTGKLAARDWSWKSISIEAVRTGEPCWILLNLLYGCVLENLASCTDRQLTSRSIMFLPLPCYSIQVFKNRRFNLHSPPPLSKPHVCINYNLPHHDYLGLQFWEFIFVHRLYTATFKYISGQNCSTKGKNQTNDRWLDRFASWGRYCPISLPRFSGAGILHR